MKVDNSFITHIESLGDKFHLDFGIGNVELSGSVAGVIQAALLNHYKTLDISIDGSDFQSLTSSSRFVSSSKNFPVDSVGMIDWFRGEIPFLHEPIPSGRMISIESDGSISWEVEKSLDCRGSYESGLRIKSSGGDGQGRATSLLIDGNLCKFLQGHNIFGSLDMNYLVLETFKIIYSQFSEHLHGLSSPDLTIQNIKKGNYLVKMLDINFLYDVKNDESVESWLHAAEMNARTRTGRALKDKGTVYIQKHSRRWAFKFYNKFRESITTKSKKHRLNDSLRGQGLEEFIKGKLRAELRLMSLELKDLGLIQGKHFTKDKLIELYNSYMGKIEMKNNATLVDEQLIKLPRTLQATYQLWRQGADLKQILSVPTYYRHKNKLLEQGIDIIFPPAKKDAPNNVIPLMRVIEAVPVVTPQWAYERGLIAC